MCDAGVSLNYKLLQKKNAKKREKEKELKIKNKKKKNKCVNVLY